MPLRMDDDRQVKRAHRVRLRLRHVAVVTLVGALVSVAAACTTPVGVINSVFGPVAPQAVKVAECESGLRPNAVSPTNDHGLFQINIVHQADFTRVTGQPWSAVYDQLYNSLYAKTLYDRQGWAPWTCKRVLGL
jgi:hypothetical protein